MQQMDIILVCLIYCSLETLNSEKWQNSRLEKSWNFYVENCRLQKLSSAKIVDFIDFTDLFIWSRWYELRNYYLSNMKSTASLDMEIV